MTSHNPSACIKRWPYNAIWFSSVALTFSMCWYFSYLPMIDSTYLSFTGNNFCQEGIVNHSRKLFLCHELISFNKKLYSFSGNMFLWLEIISSEHSSYPLTEFFSFVWKFKYLISWDMISSNKIKRSCSGFLTCVIL